MKQSVGKPGAQPPVGTVSFLFSDIEGSTKLVESLGVGYGEVLREHRSAMRRAFARHGGVERGTEGDSFFIAFGDAAGAVAAAVSATRNLLAISWPRGAEVRVRIGIHTGDGRLVDGDYVGLDLHRAARIAAAGHGGQILLSDSTRILAERALPAGVSLRDLGEHQLKDLPWPEHLYQAVLEDAPSDFPPLRSQRRGVANLPADVGSFIGREAEIATVRRLLDEARLVTVVGPGGTGKTRLVQEVARQIADAGGQDVAFVPLEVITDARLILLEILRALRLDMAGGRDPMDRVAAYVAGRRTLLIMDNLEQIDGAGLVVRSLLDRAPELSVLASSQAALHVAGERELGLGTLPLPSIDGSGAPDPQAILENPAVRLFIDRARSVRPDFDVDGANAATIVAICARLEGLPLGIELAAAQVKVLSPAAILDRLEGRLDALASRRVDVPARQRTLRATVAWSYELLRGEEQQLFRRLAAFVGGARLDEIEAMAGIDSAVPDVFRALETLVDRSLVIARPGRAGDDRFRMLETVRMYGLDLLQEFGEAAAVRSAHARVYRELAARAEPALYGSSRAIWLDRLADDHDNLRAAMDTLASTDRLDDALGLAADLWRFWQQRGHLVEGRERLDRLLRAADAATVPIPARTLSRAEEAAGSVRYWSVAERAEVRTLYERALQHAIESGDQQREAWARYNLAFIFDFVPAGTAEKDDRDRATALREEALEAFRRLGDRRGVAESLWAMGGNSVVMRSEPARARGLLEEALPHLEEIGDLYALGWARNSLAMLDADAGELDRAEARLLDAAEEFERDGDVAGRIVAVQGLGAIAALRGDDRAAVRHAAAAEAASERLGVEMPRIPPITEPLNAAYRRLDADAVERERTIGVALGVRSILETALAARREKPGGPAA